MDQLPKDVIFSILLNLQYFTIQKLCLTNKKINSIGREEHFWSEKNKRDFGSDDWNLGTSWREIYKNNYNLKYPLTGYRILIPSCGALLTVRNEQEVYFMLTNMYNDDAKGANYDDKIIQDGLIELINNWVMKENQQKLVKYRKLVNKHIKNYQYNNKFKYLATDQIHSMVQKYYLTPTTLCAIYVFDKRGINEILELLELLQYLYRMNVAKSLFDQDPEFDALIEYYKTRRAGLGKHIKNIQWISSDFLKDRLEQQVFSGHPSYKKGLDHHELNTIFRLKRTRPNWEPLSHLVPSKKYYTGY